VKECLKSIFISLELQESTSLKECINWFTFRVFTIGSIMLNEFWTNFSLSFQFLSKLLTLSRYPWTMLERIWLEFNGEKLCIMSAGSLQIKITPVRTFMGFSPRFITSTACSISDRMCSLPNRNGSYEFLFVITKWQFKKSPCNFCISPVIRVNVEIRGREGLETLFSCLPNNVNYSGIALALKVWQDGRMHQATSRWQICTYTL